MPNKRVDNLKNETDRHAGQEWQQALNVKNLTTNEWNYAASEASMGKSDDEIRASILEHRRRK